jgi:EmrB/QacA subfamily drug resistance transporter
VTPSDRSPDVSSGVPPAGRTIRSGPVVAVDAPGVDEVGVVPWTMLLRRRLAGSGRHEVTNPWVILVIVLTGLFTVSVTITLLVVSLTTIADDLGSSETALSWSITGPMLAFGIVGPAFGKAGDLWGHRRLFVLGLFGAGVFAALTAVAWDAASMIGFRTLSATCGAATGPAAMAIISRQFEGDERVRALGFWSLVTAGAPVIGVVVGGPLVEAVGWRVIFLVQAPLCAAGMLVGLRWLPESERGARSRFDVAGAVLLALAVTTLLVAVNRGPAWGWTDPRVLAGLVVSPVLLVAFFVVEQHADEPMLPVSWLRRRNVVTPVVSLTLTNFAYMGGFIITPVLLDRGLGFDTARVGLLIIARPLSFAVAAPVGSRVTGRMGERWSGVAGALIVLASMLALAAIGTSSPDWWIVVALALSGIGLGLSSPALTATVAGAVDEADLGVAGAIQQLATQVGAVVGAQVMQTVQSATESSAGLVPSFGYAYLTGAACCLLGAVAASRIRSTSGREAAGR